MKKYIHWWQPQITPHEYSYVKNVLDSGFINEGDMTEKFERKIALLLHSKYAVATSSGTIALFLSLASLEIGPGDEVIIPDITFIATANAVSLTGANSVLVDIDPESLLVDPKSIEKAITKKTRAIIPVHISGRGANMTVIKKIAQKYHIFIVEDACEAFLSMYHGRFLGTYGTLGCFSFSPNKTITTGQGGMVVTDDERLYWRLKELKDQGRKTGGTGGNDHHNSLGYNFKFTNLQAAVGLGQLHSLSKRLKRQKEIYQIYKTQLSNIGGIKVFSCDVEGGEIPLWTDALVRQRDKLVKYLLQYNIDCRKFWFPIHTQIPYKLSDQRFPQSTRLSPQAVWLPSAFTLTDDEVLLVCHLIKKFLKA
ncbi:DegT/DnrJ/EryC1/StrS family aminotransferase [Candidatus Gottesmanbacteria bacterium]|nr:DegT/DnrJ/EryC1/StrS family aminotransferase [Candidatus Gottesmanbacteria bacterium]